MLINARLEKRILHATRADALQELQVIQSLWSGYGKIVRYGLQGSDALVDSLVIKQIHLPEPGHHPRGWNTSRSHTRKLKSYDVEAYWYANWSEQCDLYCRIPRCVLIEQYDDFLLLVLEDLNTVGFDGRRVPATVSQFKRAGYNNDSVASMPSDLEQGDSGEGHVSGLEIQACLSWLAHFHATFMQVRPKGLWETGTYWHLETRPDEWKAMTAGELKEKAHLIDQRLLNSSFQTLVHGDAKLANFCFAKQGHDVAAVDFQYVGGGCGMKDVAYFLGSCLPGELCERFVPIFVNIYFEALQLALKQRSPALDAVVLEQEWRVLFPFAWADFYRFLKGWSPDHPKVNAYSQQVAQSVLSTL